MKMKRVFSISSSSIGIGLLVEESIEHFIHQLPYSGGLTTTALFLIMLGFIGMWWE
jgi:hypothetical protein